MGSKSKTRNKEKKMELDEALDEFRRQLESIEPVYKKGKVRQLLDRVLARGEMGQKRKFKKPPPPNKRVTGAAANTKENEIFGNVMPDPFGFASQDINASDKQPVAIKGAKAEKVFSLGKNTKKGKQMKISKNDRLRSRRDILAETQSSVESGPRSSHPMPKKQLAPASQEVLSQNNVTPGEPQTPPRARRARAMMARRKSPGGELHNLTECRQSTRIEQKKEKTVVEDPLPNLVKKSLSNDKEEDEETTRHSQQILENMLKRRLNNRKPVEVTIPRKKTRARPKSPTQSTQSTGTMAAPAPPLAKTPKMRQH